MPWRLLVIVLLAAISRAQAPLFPCTDPSNRQESFSDKSFRFNLERLAFSPVSATQVGYHVHHGVSLDSQLDDFSPAANDRFRSFLRSGQSCFGSSSVSNAEDNADLALIRDDIAWQLFNLARRTYKDHPQNYVETIGAGIFFPLTETSQTEEARLTSVVSRIEQIPRALAQAKANLTDADPVFIEAAVEENAGNRSVVELVGPLIDALKAPVRTALRPRYNAASKAAVAAINDFSAWLRTDLSARPHQSTWRTGPAYAAIFKFALGPGANDSLQSLLTDAEQSQDKIRAEMFALAEPLHKLWFAGHDHSALPADALLNQVVSEVLNRINQEHTTPDQLFDVIKAQARSIRAFIAARNFITLDDAGINIVPTPEFLRGIFSVAGAYPAPPLDATGSSQYWVTPISAKMSAADAESKLSEYNNWMLQYLTMHEALPGHYTQFGHANRLQPVSRRVVRNMLGSGPYAEGWGDFAVEEMIEQGYSATSSAANDPRFLLMFLKIRLRVATNAVLDIRMQSMNMTDEQALDMMEHKAFQTHAEAMGKLRRAKLSSGQLITYFVGYRQWNELRAHAKEALGARFDLKRFNDVALDEGPLPVPLLEPLLIAKLKQ